MARKVRIKTPETASKGEIFEIKTMIIHPSESGFRKDKAGKPIPRMIVNRLECTYNGQTVFAADLFPSIAENPYLIFYCKAVESGEIVFKWTDDAGEVTTATRKITVT